ncbi:hypothetical protein [Arthrobacter sp. MMS18-M83]|nr:hypothetical protein [Arthrobacter sp. MMS18-M83]WAH97253.1 hypothetical protein OW521_23415 [Arthrobacter sp. MMS18-M83]
MNDRPSPVLIVAATGSIGLHVGATDHGRPHHRLRLTHARLK